MTITASRIMESVIAKRGFIEGYLLYVHARSQADELIAPTYPQRRPPPFNTARRHYAACACLRARAWTRVV
jgi:hypothetical protein